MATSFDAIDRLSSAFQGSQLLLSAIRLELFEALGSKQLDASQLADAIGCDPRGIRILCDALVGLDLLRKSAGSYRNSAAARAFLTRDGSDSRVDRLLHSARQYETWGQLYDVVREGRPVPRGSGDPRLRGSERTFAKAMANIGRGSAEATFDQLSLDDVRTFLDVGGGPGIYVIEAARRAPELHAAVFDSVETLEVARENVSAAGLEDRISLISGDAFEDDLGGPWDLILISNLIHIFSTEKARTLVHRCADVLAPGGRLAIKDFLLDEDHTTPASGAMFAVNMLVSTEAGECFSVDEVSSWLEEKALIVSTPEALTPKSSLLTAKRQR